jgi:hypothetical protein
VYYFLRAEDPLSHSPNAETRLTIAPWLDARSLTPAAAAHQIDGGAQLKQRVIRGFDAVHAGNGVEDDLLLLQLVVHGLRGQNYRAEMNYRAIGGPMNGRVIHNVALTGDLYQDVEPDGARRDALRKFFEKIVGILALGGSVVEMLDAGSRRNVVASVPRHAILVDKAERRDAEKGFSRKADGVRLGRLNEREGGRMCAEEGLNGSWGTGGLAARGRGTQEFEELLAGSNREAVGGMADDVGLGSLSGMVGSPVESEKRTVTGVDSRLM